MNLEETPQTTPPPAEAEKPEAGGPTAAETQDTTGATPESEPEPEGPVKLKDLAEKAGIKLEDIYAAVDGKGRTYSEMSDGAESFGQLNTDRQTFEQDRNAFRLEKAQAEQQVADIVSLLPQGQVPEGLQQQLAAARNQTLEREQRLLLAAVPEWKESAQRTADIEAINEHLSAFGFNANDLNLVSDHRLLNYFRFNALAEGRLKTILAVEPKAAPKGQKRGRGKSESDGKGIDIAAMVTARE